MRYFKPVIALLVGLPLLAIAQHTPMLMRVAPTNKAPVQLLHHSAQLSAPTVITYQDKLYLFYATGNDRLQYMIFTADPNPNATPGHLISAQGKQYTVPQLHTNHGAGAAVLADHLYVFATHDGGIEYRVLTPQGWMMEKFSIADITTHTQIQATPYVFADQTEGVLLTTGEAHLNLAACRPQSVSPALTCEPTAPTAHWDDTNDHLNTTQDKGRFSLINSVSNPVTGEAEPYAAWMAQHDDSYALHTRRVALPHETDHFATHVLPRLDKKQPKPRSFHFSWLAVDTNSMSTCPGETSFLWIYPAEGNSIEAAWFARTAADHYYLFENYTLHSGGSGKKDFIEAVSTVFFNQYLYVFYRVRENHELTTNHSVTHDHKFSYEYIVPFAVVQ